MTAEPNRTLITEMSPKAARLFLLKDRSYVTFDVPYYFHFDQLLWFVNGYIIGKKLADICKKKRGTNKPKYPKNFDKVNYTALTNKDGRYSWRPMQIIHPVLYVDLVRHITEPNNWRKIRRFFRKCKESGTICESIPAESKDKSRSDAASQVSNWWERIEQESLVQSMAYSYVLVTDITDCYGSIYTHSFEWALNRGGRHVAKKKKAQGSGKNSGLGTEIDTKLQGINYGQTNGIPQGSELMNLLAEIILGYADIELAKSLDGLAIQRDSYKILRYRDDYRIFVNDLSIGHKIMRELNSTLAILGFKMNAGKTSESSDIIASSIKPEKMEHVYLSPKKQSVQKEALRIYQVTKQYPNSGLVAKLLGGYYDFILDPKSRIHWNRINIPVVIAIIAQVGVQSPKTISWVIAVISALLEQIQSELEKQKYTELAVRKLQKIPHSSFLEMWLQRLSAAIGAKSEYTDGLALAAEGKIKNTDIWNSEWLIKPMYNIMNSADISDLSAILEEKRLEAVVSREEVELFRVEYQ